MKKTRNTLACNSCKNSFEYKKTDVIVDFIKGEQAEKIGLLGLNKWCIHKIKCPKCKNENIIYLEPIKNKIESEDSYACFK